MFCATPKPTAIIRQILTNHLSKTPCSASCGYLKCWHCVLLFSFFFYTAFSFLDLQQQDSLLRSVNLPSDEKSHRWLTKAFCKHRKAGQNLEGARGLRLPHVSILIQVGEHGAIIVSVRVFVFKIGSEGSRFNFTYFLDIYGGAYDIYIFF